MLILGSFFARGRATVPDALPSEILFFSEIDSLVEDEVVGLDNELGGCGKAPMLSVFRTVLFADGIPLALPKADPALGSSGVDEVPWGVGSAEGREGGLIFDAVGVAGRLFRGGAFACGMGGRAPVGGSAVGRARTGRDIAPRSVCAVSVVHLAHLMQYHSLTSFNLLLSGSKCVVILPNLNAGCYVVQC